MSKFILPFLIILFLGTRIINLTALPIFLDESLYLRMTRDLLSKKEIWVSFTDGKEPLFFWINSTFLSVFKDALFAGRTFAVLSGLGTLVFSYLLAKTLFDKRIAFLASIFLIFSPFLFFYNRLAIIDSFLTFLLTGFIFFLTRKQFVLGGVFLGLALLTKTISQIYFFVIPWSALILDRKSFRGLILTCLSSLAIYLPLTQVSGFNAIQIKNQVFKYSLTFSVLHLNTILLTNLKTTIRHWLPYYLGAAPLLFLIIGSFSGLVKRNRKIIFLLGLILVPIFVQSFIAKIFFPRYFLFIVVPSSIIVSWAFLKIKPRFILFLLLIIQPLYVTLNLAIYNNPENLPEIEKWQYYYGWPSGNCLTLPLPEISLYGVEPPNNGVLEVVKFFNIPTKNPKFKLVNYYDPNLDLPKVKLLKNECQQPPKLYKL